MLRELDKKLGKFEVVAHEADVYTYITLNDRRLKVGGRIDRLDRVNIGSPMERLRVVDYKTGSREASDIKSVDEIFDSGNIISKHSDYIFQAFLYSLIVEFDDSNYNPKHQKVSPALLFIQHTRADDYNPVLTVNKEPVNDVGAFRDDFVRLLKDKLNEIFNPDVPFGLSSNPNICRVCPYRLMCGR